LVHNVILLSDGDEEVTLASQTETDPLARETPAWFDEAKLGVFIHWCPASVPAYAPLSTDEDLWGLPDDLDGVGKIWRRLPHAAMYQNALEIEGSPTQRFHAEHFGGVPYDAFVDRFRDEVIPACEPAPWADLCARSGARYVVLTTKLPDGFLLWPSAHRNPRKDGWQSKRDMVGEVAEAVRATGLRFGTYYCGGVDYTFGGLPIKDAATWSTAFPQDEDYVPYAMSHWRELIARYEPSVMWNDFSFDAEDDEVRALFREYLGRVPDGVINNRFQRKSNTHMRPSPVYSDFITPEYSTEGQPDEKWESCRAVGKSFGYNALESSDSYLSADDLIHMFADVVARGGNLLLNVNPTATGEIPPGEARRLLALGWWLRTDGEAIYGTRPWQRSAGITADGDGVRYTATEDAVYAIVLGRPVGTTVELDVTLDEGAEVSLVGRGGTLPWTRTPSGVLVDLPERPAERPALSLRLSPRGAVT
jgi:alpha-L-fucosidase